MTTTATNDLTALEHAGINTYATLFAYDGMEGTPLEGMSDEIYTAFVKFASDPEFRLLARFLGAAVLESAVWGSRRANQDDPPVAGFLGRAIDEVIAELTPLAESRNPSFINFVNSEDWNA